MRPGARQGISSAGAWLSAGAVVVAAALAFWPCLGGGFSDWDDDVYITGNPLVTSPEPANLGRIFTTFVSGNYHPLPILTYALEFRIFGLDPAAFHATSLVLHVLVSLLALRLFLELGLSRGPAAAAAVLFAVHPTRAEAVAWLAARKDLLMALFFLASLIAWLRWRARGSPSLWWASLGLFGLALLSKGTAAVLPLVLALSDWRAAPGPGTRPRWAPLLPFLALAAAFGAAALAARGSYEAVLQERGDSPLFRLLLGADRLGAYYLLRLVLPLRLPLLNPFYGDRVENLPPAWHLLAVLALLAALAAAVAVSLRRTRKVAFGALFFLLTLAPALAVVVVGHSAERFLYLPAAGIFYLAGAALEIPGACRRRAPACWLPVSAALVLLAVLARGECAVWRDGVSVWREAARLYPLVPSFHLNLGNSHRRRGELREAVAEYDLAISLNDRYADGFNNRGSARIGLGDLEGARQDLMKALELKPGFGGALVNLGILAVRRGEHEEGLARFTEALRAEPRLAAAWFNRGNLNGSLGRYAAAVADLDRALSLNPRNAAAWRNRGAARARLGDREGAERDFGRALELAPGDRGAQAGLSALAGPRRIDKQSAGGLRFQSGPPPAPALQEQPNAIHPSGPEVPSEQDLPDGGR